MPTRALARIFALADIDLAPLEEVLPDFKSALRAATRIGYPLVARRGYDFDVNFAGKVATWLLYASLAFVMVTRDGTDWPLWIFWAGVALAAVALAGYLLKAVREVRL